MRTAEASKIRVVIADDQYVARGFFEMYVKMSARYELAASLATAKQAVAYCLKHKVDLVILDVMMKSGPDGLTCAKELKQKKPEIKIILTTSTAEYAWVLEARAAGIDSFWFKEYEQTPLLNIMDRTMDGESVFPGSPPNPAFGAVRKFDLSDRELRILRELTCNCTNEEIAAACGISVNTVKRHIQNIMQKTGFRNRLELAINAVQIGLVIHDSDVAEPRPKYPPEEGEERT